MKFDLKQFFSRFGRQKPKTPTLESRFKRCVSSTLRPGFVLLVLMILPGVHYLAEPWFSAHWPHATILLQVLILLVPMVTAWGACIIALGTAVDQNLFLARAAQERNRPFSKWAFLGLDLPVIRYWFLWRHLAAEFPDASRWRQLGMLIGAAGFWISLIFIGPLSPIPFAALALSIGCWLGIARCIAGVPMQKKERLGWMVLLGTFLVTTLAGYMLWYQGENELKEEKQQLRSAGIPINREEFMQLLYQGRTPSPEFVKLVDRNANDDIKEGLQCLEEPSWYYKLPESKRKKLKTYLAGELCQKDFKNLDALIESGASLKYKQPLPPDSLIKFRISHLEYYRLVMRYFASRILVALEGKNPAEAMRLFRLADKFQENVLQCDFLIGALVANVCEYIRYDTIAAMLGSGLLTDDQLAEIANLHHGREEKIRSAMLNGLYAEAYHLLETVKLLNVPKNMPEILVEEKLKDKLRLWRFIFRGNTAIFPTLPNLWSDIIQQRYVLRIMRRQRAIVQYFSNPAPQRDTLRADLKRKIETRQYYLERMLLPDYFSIERKMQNILTMSKITALGLQIEQFRRKHGHLPATLDELGTPLPVDIQSGEPIRYTRFARLFEDGSYGQTISRDLPGWQLSVPSPNSDKTSEKWRESRRSYFTVITEWPVPAPPEPQPPKPSLHKPRLAAP